MTVDYLINLFKNCEHFNGFKIGAGFLLEKSNSVSVVPDGEESVIRTYCDGAKIKSIGFSLIIRLASDFGDNSEHFAFLDKVSRWIDSYKNFPEGFQYEPLRFEIVKGAKLTEDNVHSLKYNIKCRFLYLQE